MARILIVVQARLASTRLPRKVLMDIGGATLLDRQMRRLHTVRAADGIVVATTDRPEDEEICRACRALGVPAFVGSSEDVLGRYLACADVNGAEAVVRVTGDNPLVDPAIIDEIIGLWRERGCDYINNIHLEGSVKGTGSELVATEALRTCDRRSESPYHREHVTTYMKDHLEEFSCHKYVPAADICRPDYSVSVDRIEDLEVVRRVYANFGFRDDVTTAEVVAFLDAHPEVRRINDDFREPMARMT
jgi:spore coat polysaccharide biosynthesis protein SpsF (cytidylyltransferase family)